MRIKHSIWVGIALAVGACASPQIPYQQPVVATPPTGEVVVSQALTILDASGSQEGLFAEGKATLESLVSIMPEGDYRAGELYFGGAKRESTGLPAFDRASLGRFANEATYLRGTTPIFDVLENDVTDTIGTDSGRAAIVLISDGLATDYAGHPRASERTVEAARAIVASRSGETCFHMIQSGDSPAGAALLQQIAEVSDCGSVRNASTLTNTAALQQFSRDVYLGNAPTPAPSPTPPVAAAADSDSDGVADPKDSCPNSLKQARVDSRGCWTLRDLKFAVNGAEIDIDLTAQLREDLAVLAANPEVRVRIDGHTDSDGSAAYNDSLSSRRAAGVRDFIVNKGGLDADRFEVKGFGESKPLAPNDSPSNKRLNRRVELTILD